MNAQIIPFPVAAKARPKTIEGALAALDRLERIPLAETDAAVVLLTEIHQVIARDCPAPYHTNIWDEVL